MTHTLRNIRLPGPKSQAQFEAEARYLAPGTQSVALFSRLCIDRGEGAVLYDADGNSYIDLLAGVGVASLGYAHPKYVAGLQRQIARVHVGSFTTEHRAALVKVLDGNPQFAPAYVEWAKSFAAEGNLPRALALARTGEKFQPWLGGYHLLTGELHVCGATYMQRLQYLLSQAPRSLGSVRPDLHPKLIAIVERTDK